MVEQSLEHRSTWELEHLTTILIILTTVYINDNEYHLLIVADSGPTSVLHSD